MIFARKLVAAATIALVALSGSAQALSPQEEHFEVLANQLANATAVSIDLEPLLEVLNDEIHNFVEMRSDEKSTHKLIEGILNDIVDSEDDETKSHEEKFQSFEAFSGLMDVVGVPHGNLNEDDRRVLARRGGLLSGGLGGGNVMIPPGTFIGGSPFIGLNDNPAKRPFTYTDEGLRALPAELQAHFNEFYAEYCLQAAINDDAGQYNFPGFDLGSIEIEVSNGGCVVDKHSQQLVCSPGAISYSKSPASLNGFSKNGVNYQGSYCPGLQFPKKMETEFSASVGGTTTTVFNKQDHFKN
jgi:hypothetical protein